MLRRSLLATALGSLLLATALAGCGGSGTSGNDDADGDGLTDNEERAERDITVVTSGGSGKLTVTSDPVRSDTDGDTLNDGDEDEKGTSPRSPDTDGDLLLDGFNVTLPAADPRVSEWRAAGILESPLLTFLGELAVCRHVGGLKGDQFSSDRPFSDALGDGAELAGWDITVRGQARHVSPDPCSPDGDSDHARDEQELALGTDPSVNDTDADGAVDGADLDPLWDVRIALVDVTASQTNGSVVVFAGGANATLAPGAPGRLEFDVPEEVIGGGITRETFEHKAILYASDALTGEPLRLFGEGFEALLSFRIADSTVTVDGEPLGGTLTFTGSDGTLSMRWEVVRR